MVEVSLGAIMLRAPPGGIMKSVMHQKDGTCYLCMLLNQDYGPKQVEEHHCIYGSARRILSETYGLKVYLCPEHHRTGKNAVHQNSEISDLVKKKAQEAFEREYPQLNFFNIFGKNYK